MIDSASAPTQQLGKSGWLHEPLDDGFRYSIRSSQLLCHHETDHQNIEVHSTPSFGYLLRTDGSFMAGEKDEFFYHENLVHVPANAHAALQSALIIGGGDGGSAEELLKHSTIQSIKLVEIDQIVVDVSRTYLHRVNHGVMDIQGGDSRLEIFIADGLEYKQNSMAMYDLIILDLTDPGGPSQPLYTASFYQHCAARLKPGGLLSLQVASPFAQPERVVSTLTATSQVFRLVSPYLVTIPLSDGQWMMACALQTVDPKHLVSSQTDQVILDRGLHHLQHYNGHTYQAVVALPNFVLDMIKTTGAKLT